MSVLFEFVVQLVDVILLFVYIGVEICGVDFM